MATGHRQPTAVNKTQYRFLEILVTKGLDAFTQRIYFSAFICSMGACSIMLTWIIAGTQVCSEQGIRTLDSHVLRLQSARGSLFYSSPVFFRFSFFISGGSGQLSGESLLCKPEKGLIQTSGRCQRTRLTPSSPFIPPFFSISTIFTYCYGSMYIHFGTFQDVYRLV